MELEQYLNQYKYYPEVDRYKCKKCEKLYKTETGIWKHLEEKHKIVIDKS